MVYPVIREKGDLGKVSGKNWSHSKTDKENKSKNPERPGQRGEKSKRKRKNMGVGQKKSTKRRES